MSPQTGRVGYAPTRSRTCLTTMTLVRQARAIRVSQRSGSRLSSNSIRPSASARRRSVGESSSATAAALAWPAISRRQPRQYAMPFTSSQLAGNPDRSIASSMKRDVIPHRAQVHSDPVTLSPRFSALSDVTARGKRVEGRRAIRHSDATQFSGFAIIGGKRGNGVRTAGEIPSRQEEDMHARVTRYEGAPPDGMEEALQTKK